MLKLAHNNLDVYKKALMLIKEVYKPTSTFPRNGQFILVSQLRRAALSVVSNIGEGASRSSRAERKRFYEISRGSIVEISTQFEVAVMHEYPEGNQLIELESYLETVFRMLSKMINELKE